MIDAATWRLHAGWLAALALAMTLGWHVLQPYAHHDLKTQAFIAPMTIVAFTYLVVYSFALILAAICYVMLTMKRLRDRARPTALAGLVPLLILLAAATHFMNGKTPDVVGLGWVIALDLATVVAALLTIADLGFGAARAAGGVTHSS